MTHVDNFAKFCGSGRRSSERFLSSNDRQEPDPLSVTAPEAAAYEFQSGGVVEMLEKLDGKFDSAASWLEPLYFLNHFGQFPP